MIAHQSDTLTSFNRFQTFVRSCLKSLIRLFYLSLVVLEHPTLRVILPVMILGLQGCVIVHLLGVPRRLAYLSKLAVLLWLLRRIKMTARHSLSSLDKHLIVSRLNSNLVNIAKEETWPCAWVEGNRVCSNHHFLCEL